MTVKRTHFPVEIAGVLSNFNGGAEVFKVG